MRIGAISRLVTLTLFAAASTIAARADIIFSFTPDAGNLSYSFTLPDNGAYNTLPDVSSAYTGTINLEFTDPSFAGLGFDGMVGFYNASSPVNSPFVGLPPLDMVIVDNDTSTAYFYVGPQLYTGTEANPVFTSGSYHLIGTSGQPDGTLTITASTPEPSSLALLGTGVLAMLGTGRRLFR